MIWGIEDGLGVADQCADGRAQTGRQHIMCQMQQKMCNSVYCMAERWDLDFRMCHLQLIFMPKIDVLQHLAFVVLCA